MLSDDAKHILAELKRGRVDPPSESVIESLSAQSFVDDMQKEYGFVFQQRAIGRKNEIGLARRVSYMLTFKHMGQIKCSFVRPVRPREA
jgi:hypothetical protein